jgi:hypothetical protein
MAGRTQEEREGNNPACARFKTGANPLNNGRVGEFQEAGINRPLESVTKHSRKFPVFGRSLGVSTAVANQKQGFMSCLEGNRGHTLLLFQLGRPDG